MYNFRIYLYLKLYVFFKSLFLNEKKLNEKINKNINEITKKKFFIVTSRLRTGFFLLLKYLKQVKPKKNEILFQTYNLPSMVQIAYKLGFKLKFYNLDKNSGEILISDIKKKISKKTLCIIVSNIFNSEKSLIILKKICKKKKILLIEDNAIYYDNYYYNSNQKKIFAGSFGDYSLFSFNIMKHISAFYGGGVATNDYNFKTFAENKIKKYKSFPKTLFIKQVLIFFILKIFLIKIFYKNIYMPFLIKAYKKIGNSFFLKLVYPSLNFKKNKFDESYFSKITLISKKVIYLQLLDRKNRVENYFLRKKNNFYYYKYLSKINHPHFSVLKLSNFNFQNYLEFPIFAKNKEMLNRYLLSKGIECKYINYMDCEKIYLKNKKKENFFSKYCLGLPSHQKIQKNYIMYIVKNINEFYKKR